MAKAPLTCRQVVDRLSRYVDGELSVDEARAVEVHLATCASCDAELRAMRGVAGLLDDAVTTVQPPSLFDDAIMREIRSRRQSPLLRWWRSHIIVAPRPSPYTIAIGGRIAVALACLIAFYLASLTYLPPDHKTLVLGQSRLDWNAPASFRVVAYSNSSTDPEPGVPVSMSVRDASGAWHDLYAGLTNTDGTVNASFRLPASVLGDCVLKVSTGTWYRPQTMMRTISVGRRVRLMVTTDRPVYKPNQTVHIRTLALDEGLQNPASGQDVRFEVMGPEGTVLYRTDVTASAWGIASTDFDGLTAEGDYRITASIGSASSEQTVTVAEYDLPKFRVDVAPDKPYFLPRETTRIDVSAAYFDGKPLAHAGVDLDMSTLLENGVARLHGVTDAAGHFIATIRLPKVENDFAGGTDVLITAGVTDHNGDREHATVEAPFDAQPIQISVIPENGSMTAGLTNGVYIVTSYPDGTPAATTGTLSIGSLGSIAFTTDSGGIAEANVDVANLPVQLAVDARDSEGRAGHVETSFDNPDLSAYLRGLHSDQVNVLTAGSNDGIVVRPDRSIYHAGDTLHATILARRSSGAVYFDIARDGQTMLTQSGELQNGICRLSVDIPSDMTGTLTLNAYYLNDGLAMVRSTRRVVVRPADGVVLTMSSDKPVYRPGDDARLTFHVRDKSGAPVASAIGLDVVDESVYALRETMPGFEGDFYAIDEAQIKARYGLPSTFGAPREGEDESSMQQTTAVELAFFPSPKNFFIDASPALESRAHLLDVGDTDYALRMDSEAQRQASVAEFQKKYAGGLLLLLDLALVVLAGYFFYARSNFALAMWAPFAAIVLFIGVVSPAIGTIIAAACVGVAALSRYTTTPLWEWVAAAAALLVLAAVLFPVFAQAREKARSISVISDLKQIGLAEAMAQDESNEQNQAPRTDWLESKPARAEIPETLAWNPEIVTDDNGDAELTIPTDGSTTTWRASAIASTMDGRMGSTTIPIRVEK